jgi:hypothetical protein
MDHQAKIKDYDAKIQQALDSATPAGKELADRLSYAKQSYLAHSPWGSEGNHPGILGRVEHGLARGAEIAADIAAPGLTQAIPGTPERMAREQAGTQKNMQEDTALQTARNAEENKADKTAAPIYKEATQGGLIDPKHPELGPQQAYVNQNDPTDIKFSGNMPPKAGAEKDKPLTPQQIADTNAGFKQRWEVLHPNQPVPENSQLRDGATAADFDRTDKQMQQSETATGTKAQQDQTRAIQQQTFAATQAERGERQQEREQARDEKLVNYRDKDGNLVSGTRGEAKAAGVDDKDIHGSTNPAMQEKARQAYAQYGRIIDNVKSAETTLPAWSNPADKEAAMKVAKNFWSDLDGHISVAPFGIGASAGVAVNPEYRQQFINDAAYKSMSPQGQEHMQNMFQLWSDAINIIKQETGGVPRGQQFLQMENKILPQPEKTPEMNQKALENLANRIRQDAKSEARPSDMDSLGGVAPHGSIPVMVNGKEVGYTDSERQKKGEYTKW